MASLKWNIMTDDVNYYCGMTAGKHLVSLDERDSVIYDSKEEVYKVVEEVKKVYPNAQVYITCEA